MRETIQNANGKQFHAVSLSGGKDSTAMLLLMIERGRLKAPPVHGAPEKPHKKEMEAR